MKKSILWAILPVLILVLAGCGQDNAGQNQQLADKGKSWNVPEVKMAALLADPKPYAGKDIVMSGTFNGACCATDFILKDGFETVEVYTSGACPMPDESRKYAKMDVLGTVQLRGNEVSVVAKEVRFE